MDPEYKVHRNPGEVDGFTVSKWGDLMRLLTRDRRKKENKYLQKSLWWWELTLVSGCCKHDHVISAEELIRHFRPLSAAPGCSTSCLNNVEDLLLLWTRLCRDLPLQCAFVKGRLRLKSEANFLYFSRRSCLKAALDEGAWCGCLFPVAGCNRTTLQLHSFPQLCLAESEAIPRTRHLQWTLMLTSFKNLYLSYCPTDDIIFNNVPGYIGRNCFSINYP